MARQPNGLLMSTKLFFFSFHPMSCRAGSISSTAGPLSITDKGLSAAQPQFGRLHFPSSGKYTLHQEMLLITVLQYNI